MASPMPAAPSSTPVLKGTGFATRRNFVESAHRIAAVIDPGAGAYILDVVHSRFGGFNTVWIERA